MSSTGRVVLVEPRVVLDVDVPGGSVVPAVVVPGAVVGEVSDVVGGGVTREVDVAGLVVGRGGDVVTVVEDAGFVVDVRPVVVDVRPVVVVVTCGVVEVVDGGPVVLVCGGDEEVVEVPTATVVRAEPLVEVIDAVVLDGDVVGRDTGVFDACEVGGAIRGSGGAVGAGIAASSGPRSR